MICCSRHTWTGTRPYDQKKSSRCEVDRRFQGSHWRSSGKRTATHRRSSNSPRMPSLKASYGQAMGSKGV